MRIRHHRGTFVTQSQPRRADEERAYAVSVRYSHPYPIAADADARVHPQGLIADGAGLGGCRRGGPGTDPMQVFWHGAFPPSMVNLKIRQA
jgi:hypothetical protein